MKERHVLDEQRERQHRGDSRARAQEGARPPTALRTAGAPRERGRPGETGSRARRTARASRRSGPRWDSKRRAGRVDATPPRGRPSRRRAIPSSRNGRGRVRGDLEHARAAARRSPGRAGDVPDAGHHERPERAVVVAVGGRVDVLAGDRRSGPRSGRTACRSCRGSARRSRSAGRGRGRRRGESGRGVMSRPPPGSRRLPRDREQRHADRRRVRLLALQQRQQQLERRELAGGQDAPAQEPAVDLPAHDARAIQEAHVLERESGRRGSSPRARPSRSAGSGAGARRGCRRASASAGTIRTRRPPGRQHLRSRSASVAVSSSMCSRTLQADDGVDPRGRRISSRSASPSGKR